MYTLESKLIITYAVDDSRNTQSSNWKEQVLYQQRNVVFLV